jgi:hypothetical protein
LGPPGPARDGSITAEVGFTAPYAFNQHEHLEYNHPEGGQAKYLQSVVEERRERWVADMREAAIEAFRRSLK